MKLGGEQVLHALEVDLDEGHPDGEGDALGGLAETIEEVADYQGSEAVLRISGGERRDVVVSDNYPDTTNK